MKNWIVFVALVCILFSCGNKSNQKTGVDFSSEDAVSLQTLKEAYIFGFPLVIMDVSKDVLTNVETPSEKGAPINQIDRKGKFPDDTFTDVVKPNCDTYYASAFIDLAKEPLVLTAPNTRGRYYLLPILDAWTNVFASPGKRTNGTDAKTFLITGPRWNGNVPEGMEQLKSPTNFAWMVGRTQVNNKEDGETLVKRIQDGYQLVPLSAYGIPYIPPTNTVDAALSKEPPIDQVFNMPTDVFFNRLNALMIQNPPSFADSGAMKKFKSLGIEPGGTFDLAKFPANIQDSIKTISSKIKKYLSLAAARSAASVNGWNMNSSTGDYKTNYLQRAVIAMFGLGANLSVDAMYPSVKVDADGQKFDGSKYSYLIHFEKERTPPANAFWSLTMYNDRDLLVKNSINRFAIGDRDKLKYNADGTLDIFIQKDNPGKVKESNWLPAPDASFSLLLRVYWPKEEMLNGSWTPPPVVKASK